MKKFLKSSLLLLMAAAVLIGCTACTGQSGQDPMDMIPESTGGKDVARAKAADNVFSLNVNTKYSLNPLIATDHSNQLICSLVYENMLEVDNDFEAIPAVITEWKCSEDAKLWTFTVGEGHTFHDGSPVTPKDLRYSMDRAISSDRYSGRFSSIQGTSHTEDSLIIALGVPDTQFYKLMNLPIMKAGSFNDTPPIGSGPYTFNEDMTELVKWEDYQTKKLPVDKIYLKEYPEAESKIIAFEDSVLDLVINDPSSYTSLGFASTNEVHKYATTNLHFVAFNEKSPLGAMNSFRVAMQYAFDRDYFVELLHGNAVASAVPMYPSCKDYPQQMNKDLRYDLEKCRNIIESIGFKDYDEDGYLEMMESNPDDIQLTFLVCSGSTAKDGVVNRFASDMDSLGIKVLVEELPWENYMKALQDGYIEKGNKDKGIKKKEFDMYYGEVKLRNNFDLTELLQVRPEPKKKDEPLITTNINFTHSKDPAFEEYIKSYLAAGDLARADAYRKLCEYISLSTGSLISIGFEKHQIISHRGVVKGIDANAGNPLYNFENWEINLD